ncbi:hypothetical protein [Undibacterium aquatile]|uniref:Uncharacterized protein n=1 Tax=Undibacterium aquatile TaxID=1537398 RepID=A0ABR6XJE4_9BURK|nr:hypothetical protein [Undibacterium aquatile]MBC3812858.1 hypothetical protein [Undibacterium aquatile]
MPEPLITGSAIAAGWKILGSLYDKYNAWSVKKSNSKKAQELKERAEKLMNEINSKILGGASSSDPDLAPVIKEFLNLLAQDAKPQGYEKTQDWIVRASRPAVSGIKPVAKKAAAKPVAKKAAAKPVAKKAAAKPVAKKAAAKPVAKKVAAKPVAKKVVG